MTNKKQGPGCLEKGPFRPTSHQSRRWRGKPRPPTGKAALDQTAWEVSTWLLESRCPRPLPSKLWNLDLNPGIRRWAPGPLCC